VVILPSQIQALIEAELAQLNDERVVQHVRASLVQPKVVMRGWDFGKKDEAYPCWSVLEHQRSNNGIAYCEFGFGPRAPWGLVTLSGLNDMSMGMDCDWFETFLQAFFDSAAATELHIWSVFTQVDERYPGVAITGESDWTSTWDEVKRLRNANPGIRYHCEQSIYAWRSDDLS
jgi:hypothetical protein